MTTQETLVKLPPSVLISKQTRTYRKDFIDAAGNPVTIIAQVRHDNNCNNRHNSFAITADVYERDCHRGEPTVKHAGGKTLWLNSCGCQHDLVADHFPNLAPFIKWHLTSTDGLMHYVSNGLYWAGHQGWRDGKHNSPPNIEHLKSTIIYGALPEDSQFDLEDHIYSDARGFTWNEAKANALRDWLVSRIERLMIQFKKDVEALGLTY